MPAKEKTRCPHCGRMVSVVMARPGQTPHMPLDPKITRRALQAGKQVITTTSQIFDDDGTPLGPAPDEADGIVLTYLRWMRTHKNPKGDECLGTREVVDQSAITEIEPSQWKTVKGEENARLRQEIAALRRELALLRGETPEADIDHELADIADADSITADVDFEIADDEDDEDEDVIDID